MLQGADMMQDCCSTAVGMMVGECMQQEFWRTPQECCKVRTWCKNVAAMLQEWCRRKAARMQKNAARMLQGGNLMQECCSTAVKVMPECYRNVAGGLLEWWKNLQDCCRNDAALAQKCNRIHAGRMKQLWRNNNSMLQIYTWMLWMHEGMLQIDSGTQQKYWRMPLQCPRVRTWCKNVAILL